MKLNNNQIREFVKNADFKELFVELGWDNVPQNQSINIQVKDKTFRFEPIKQKRGFVIYMHEAENADQIPDRQTGLKIENKITQITAEHLLIFTDKKRTTQIWQWSKREPNEPVRISREIFVEGMSGERLAQKLKNLFFSIEDEEYITITDVASRNDALFRERLTRRFYDEFKSEHKKFSKQIEGIKSQEECDWYASLTLNRLMFVYFIQYKGFLNKDGKYLRNKLYETQNKIGDDMFYSFYKTFLVQFFHNGLGEPNHSPELVKIIGNIPYLNGGLFEKHRIESENDIQIKDEAFEAVFNFFDKYDWHLDHRPLRDDNVINPDVLGYIFEKFINQKQMGAYYTKEDITEYISENTIIPFLFDRVKEKSGIAFNRYDGIWQTLRDDPDRYIYDAVKKGVIDENGEITEVPAHIAAGIEDVSKRGNWNEPANEEYALPTEIWREYIARRERCLSIREKMRNGEIYEINDLITYNLDIRQFAQDVVHNAEDSGFIKAFYQAIAGRIPERSNERFEQGITILDPTCGSGAFLFAALKILEPLLDKCLDRMEEFVEMSDQTGKTNAHQTFRNVLTEIEKHPSRDYFVMKSIIINNLFGVDIMPDAVEICKLRLFLQLVAQVDADPNKKNYGLEPLPDIDFNIRAGNTLVGFVNKKSVHEAFGGRDQQRFDFDNLADEFDFKAEQTAKVYEQFRLQQVKEGGEIKAEDKAELQAKLRELSDELNVFIAHEYGISEKNETAFQNFLKTHQPFHWYSEFYGIINDGGFDVIIGNPPYVEYTKIKKDYTIRSFITESCGNLYAFVMEKSIQLLNKNGRSGLIVLIGSLSTNRMQPLQAVYENSHRSLYLSSYSGHTCPGVLFEGVANRYAIWLTADKSDAPKTLSSKYMKWYSSERDYVFKTLQYISNDGFALSTIPKTYNRISNTIYDKLLSKTELVGTSLNGNEDIYIYTTPIHWMKAFSFIPYFKGAGKNQSTQLKNLSVSSKYKNLITCILNSSLFFWWWIIHSDCYHLTSREYVNFPIQLKTFSDSDLQEFSLMEHKLMEDFDDKSVIGRRNQQTTGLVEFQVIDPKLSKSIIDEIDRVLAKHYGFTDEELDFIINYDIKYRMGLGS